LLASESALGGPIVVLCHHFHAHGCMRASACRSCRLADAVTLRAVQEWVVLGAAGWLLFPATAGVDRRMPFTFLCKRRPGSRGRAGPGSWERSDRPGRATDKTVAAASCCAVLTIWMLSADDTLEESSPVLVSTAAVGSRSLPMHTAGDTEWCMHGETRCFKQNAAYSSL